MLKKRDSTGGPSEIALAQAGNRFGFWVPQTPPQCKNKNTPKGVTPAPSCPRDRPLLHAKSKPFKFRAGERNKGRRETMKAKKEPSTCKQRRGKSAKALILRNKPEPPHSRRIPRTHQPNFTQKQKEKNTRGRKAKLCHWGKGRGQTWKKETHGR